MFFITVKNFNEYGSLQFQEVAQPVRPISGRPTWDSALQAPQPSMDNAAPQVVAVNFFIILAFS
jgi:hypothetical protein